MLIKLYGPIKLRFTNYIRYHCSNAYEYIHLNNDKYWTENYTKQNNDVARIEITDRK